MERVNNNVFEDYVGAFEAHAQLEASITLNELIGSEQLENYPGFIFAGPFVRDGLGVWNSIIIEQRDIIIISAPDGQEDFGISIWYGEGIRRESVMEIIRNLSELNDIEFMDPYSGEILDKDTSYDRGLPSP